jgi:hypothetical protein
MKRVRKRRGGRLMDGGGMKKLELFIHQWIEISAQRRTKILNNLI